MTIERGFLSQSIIKGTLMNHEVSVHGEFGESVERPCVARINDFSSSPRRTHHVAWLNPSTVSQRYFFSTLELRPKFAKWDSERLSFFRVELSCPWLLSISVSV